MQTQASTEQQGLFLEGARGVKLGSWECVTPATIGVLAENFSHVHVHARKCTCESLRHHFLFWSGAGQSAKGDMLSDFLYELKHLSDLLTVFQRTVRFATELGGRWAGRQGACAGGVSGGTQAPL